MKSKAVSKEFGTALLGVMKIINPILQLEMPKQVRHDA
jgi:hypothetical protein